MKRFTLQQRPLPILSLGSVLMLSACGTVPSNESTAESNLKNYDRTLYEQLSTEDASLYDRLGGYEAIEAFVIDGVDNLLADERINFLFEGVDANNLVFQLSEQICDLAGGPCIYDGMSMEDAHFGLDITEAQFNALVEDFQQAMRDNDVPYGLENQVVALLAPMKPAIINR
ncbi:MAG: group 1 truncated hemoglobin [Pseudomonadota bacterium]